MPALPDPGVWRGRRILLTGHTGFKGAWLALWLAEMGAEVHGIGAAPQSEPSLYEQAGVREVLAREDPIDIRDAAAVHDAVRRTDADVVLHLAAQALVRRSLAEPAETFAVNALGTAHLLDALPDTTQAVVVVTSDKCYRDVESGRPMREDDALGGRDPYSASKAAQELVAASFRELRGLPLATARAGNVIGGGDWGADRLVPDAIRAARSGDPLILRNPDAVRPWQHVLNPLSGYLVLAEALIRGEDVADAFNFGPAAGDMRSVSWLVERLAERLPGPPLDIRIAPDADARREAAVLRLDSAKAAERLGWTPTWDVEQAIAATVDWYGAASPRDACKEQFSAFTGRP